jgi:hypothetical protein
MDRRGVAGLSSRGIARRDPEFIATFAFVFIGAVVVDRSPEAGHSRAEAEACRRGKCR